MLEMVSGRNFRSYERVKLEFGKQRVSVVFGSSSSDYADSNGTGKTSLMYLALWTLFGKWPGMENADSCVHQPTNKDCCGIVWITKPDGRYAISRYRRDTLHGNNVFIQPPNHNDAATLAPDIISGDLKVMNERIEALLGMNYETFVRTMVFTGSDSENFSLMTDREQKALLDTIFPVDFSGLLDRAKAKHKFALETEIECNGVVKAIDQWIVRSEQALMNLEEQAEEIARQSDETVIRHQLADLEQAKYETVMEAEEAGAASMSLGPQIDAAQVAVTAYRETMKQFDEAKDRWAAFMAAKQGLAEQEKSRESALQWIDKDIANGKARLEHDEHQKTCHACGQSLPEPALQKVTASTREELNALSTKRLETIRHFDEIQAGHITKQTRSGFDDNSSAEFVVNIKLAQQHMKQLQDRYDALTRQDRDLDTKVRGLREQEARYAAEITRLEALLKPGDQGMAQIKAEQERLTTELARLKKDRKQAATNQEQWVDEKALWSNVTDMFGGGKNSIQHFMFEALLPEMTATAQMFLSLFSQDELRVAFKSHRAKGSKTVEGFYIEATKGENTKGYGDLSGGERRRIDFCIFLTLHLMAAKHLFSPGVLFLDEIADFMDDTGQQNIVTSVLDFLCREYGVSCLLLTNKRELVASVAHGYRCEMHNGVSTLVPVQET